MQYTHDGLIFGNDDVETARHLRDSSPYAGGWSKFDALMLDSHLRANRVASAVYDALRWRLMADEPAGARALDAWPALMTALGGVVGSTLEELRHMFGLLHAHECLLGHPVYGAEHRAALAAALHQHVVLTAAEHQMSAVVWPWCLAVQAAAGVVLEAPALLEGAAAELRTLIERIRPEGYLVAVVEPSKGDPNTMLYTLGAVHGMVLAAEVLAHAGIDVWSHEVRGVSLMTAAFYPLYYYYYPEKWPWAVDPLAAAAVLPKKRRQSAVPSSLTLDAAQQMFRSHAALLEIVNRRRPGVRAIQLILDEVRPVVDVLGGGAVTLTHAPPLPKKRGWFGRS
jgi:hypothetical protein